MAKWKRLTVGTVVKGKKNEETGVTAPSYIQVSKHQVPILLEMLRKNGDNDFYINLESKKMQQDNLNEADKQGKISGEAFDSVQERINKIPDFVLFQLVKLEKQ